MGNDREHNVLVIGNGYDLAHGLHTSYNDFIDFIRRVKDDDSIIVDEAERDFVNKCIRVNGFLSYFLAYTKEIAGWVDLEQLIKEVSNLFGLFFSNFTHIIDKESSISWDSVHTDMSENGKMRIINCLSMFPLFDRNYSRSYIHSFHLDKKYFTELFGLNKREILKLLKEQLDEIICLLSIYLKNHMNEKRGSINKISQIEAIKPFYVISFNYTDTYKIYGIEPEDVFHVHGSLAEDNMVLGFNDENPENLDFVYFKKYFQRIQKLTGYIDESRFSIVDDKEFEAYQPTVHFYGHSMDKTDEDVIKKLAHMASKFVIYHYNQEDYEQKVINLVDVFGKEDVMKMIEKGWIKFVAI